jgi:hypothetical protein
LKLHRHTAHARDAALARLRSANRWLIAGSIALTGALSAVAARAFPGRTLKSTASAGAARKGGSARPAPTPAPTPLRAPEQSPENAPNDDEGESRAQAPEQPAPSREAERPAPQPEGQASEAPATQQPESESSAPVVSGGS